jgi:hypothetical protein
MERIFAQVQLKDLTPSPNITTFADIVNVVVKNAFMLAGLLSFVILVFGRFSVIMGAGAGDTKKLEQGKKAITGAVVGLIIVVVSVWIIQILEKLTGQSILTSTY